MSKTIEMIKKYIPYNAQEEKDKQFFIDCEAKDQILTRENELCHLTSSAFIINKTHNKVLCTYHNIFNSWTCSCDASLQKDFNDKMIRDDNTVRQGNRLKQNLIPAPKDTFRK